MAYIQGAAYNFIHFAKYGNQTKDQKKIFIYRLIVPVNVSINWNNKKIVANRVIDGRWKRCCCCFSKNYIHMMCSARIIILRFFLLCLNLSVQISLSVCADMCMLLAHFFFLNCFNYFFKWTKIVCYDKSHSNLSRRSSSEALKNIDAHKHHLFLLFFFRSFCAIASISICRMDFLRFTLFSPRSLLNRKRKNSRLSSMQIQFSKHLLVGCRCASSTFLRL